MLDIGCIDIYIKNYNDKQEILNKIKNIFLYSNTICQYYVELKQKRDRNDDKRAYLTQHIKNKSLCDLQYIKNNFTIQLDLLNKEQHFDFYKDFIEFIDEQQDKFIQHLLKSDPDVYVEETDELITMVNHWLSKYFNY